MKEPGKLTVHLPKTTCFPSSQEVTAVVIKNWEPFVSRPEFAMERSPGFVCLDSKFSSVFGSLGRGCPNRYSEKGITTKFGTIYGSSTGAVAVREVPALEHELGYNTVEDGSLISESMLAGGKFPEILRRPRHNIVVQLEDNPARSL